MHPSYAISTRFTQPPRVERQTLLFTSAIISIWSITLLYLTMEILLAYKTTSIASQHGLGSSCWLAILAEFLLSFQELVLAFGLLTGLCSSGRRSPRPSYEITGHSAPTIDVFITCCGEAHDIILDTVKAAAAQDYPPGSFRVLVLDDGRDEELRRQVQLLEPWLKERRFAHVKYHARTVKKGAKSFFKSGNLNHGLSEVAVSPPSEFFAALDCDMIPEPYWLKRSVGHLLLDDKVAMTVAPQVST